MRRSGSLAAVFALLAGVTAYGQVKIQSGFIVGEIRAVSFGSSPQIARELGAAGWVECAGQSLKRSDFPTLAKLTNNAWGSADVANTFFLPDLRGLFLRGWQHSALPGQPPPLGGDSNAAERLAPRGDVAPPGAKGATGDNVGSLQQDRAKVEQHTHSEVRETGTKRRADSDSEQFMHTPRTVQTGPPEGEATKWETRPKNAFVMYIIYLGRPVTIGADGRIDAVK